MAILDRTWKSFFLPSKDTRMCDVREITVASKCRYDFVSTIKYTFVMQKYITFEVCAQIYVKVYNKYTLTLKTEFS